MVFNIAGNSRALWPCRHSLAMKMSENKPEPTSKPITSAELQFFSTPAHWSANKYRTTDAVMVTKPSKSIWNNFSGKVASAGLIFLGTWKRKKIDKAVVAS